MRDVIPLVRLGPGGEYVKDYTPAVGPRGARRSAWAWARAAWRRLRARVVRAWRA